MRRLQAVDVILLTLFLPIWFLCFSVYFYRTATEQLAWMPVFVTTPPNVNDYPKVREFWTNSGTEAAGLVVGDQLIRVGNVDLRGAGPLSFIVRAYEAVDKDLRIPVFFLRENTLNETVLSLRRVSFPWRMLPLSLGFAITAVLVLLQSPGPRLARAFFLASMTYSLYWTYCFGGGPRWLTYLWASVFFSASLCMFPLMLRAISLFPEEITPTGARLPWWPWLFTVYGLIMTSMAFGAPFSHTVGLQANFIMTAVFIAILFVLLVRNFSLSGPIGRRQLKWVVYGIYIGAAPVLVADMITMFRPELMRLHEIATMSLALIPLCIFIAIVRFNLFDIDRLISSTATYSVLFGLLVGGMLVGAPQLSLAASKAFGVEPTSGYMLLSFLLATLILPGQRFLRPHIERLFFRERYTLEQGVQRLVRELSEGSELQNPLLFIGERLEELWRPESCVIYQHRDDHYAPVFARGGVAPSTFEARGAILGALQTKAAHGEGDTRWRRAVHAQLRAADHAALATIPTEAVFSVGREEPPAVFVCLGAKRSGDVYTMTDMTLLEEIAEKVTEKAILPASVKQP